MKKEQNNTITICIRVGSNEFSCTGPITEVNKQRNYFFSKVINKKEKDAEDKNKKIKEFYAPID